MSDDRTKFAAAQVEQWLVGYLARLVGMEESEVDRTVPFTHYGLDSSAAVGLSTDLGDMLGAELDLSLAYDYPTIQAVTDYLSGAGFVEREG